jgi:hypothetical protein
VCGEYIVADLIGKPVAVGFEIALNPADVMFGGIGMGDLFAQGNGGIEHFARFDFIGTIDYRDMFFGFPVGGLMLIANFSHFGCLLFGGLRLIIQDLCDLRDLCGVTTIVSIQLEISA